MPIRKDTLSAEEVLEPSLGQYYDTDNLRSITLSREDSLFAIQEEEDELKNTSHFSSKSQANQDSSNLKSW